MRLPSLQPGSPVMNQEPSLAGRVAIVTGAGSGIGRSIAECLAADGARVVVTDRDADAARATAAPLAAARLEAEARVTDVADAAACRDLVEGVVNEHGRVDILVNNAGLQHVAPLVDFPEERWRYLLGVMVDGPFHLTRAVLPGMIERRWGRIVNIGSIHSLVASPNKAAYVTAKHALLGLTRATALEAGEYGITCNLVAPAYVRTPLVEGQIAEQARLLGIDDVAVVDTVMLEPSAVRRLVEPSEVGAYVRFLCSAAAASITGAVQVIDGGWTAR